MKGKEPMHVPEWVLNETGKERFALTPRDPVEITNTSCVPAAAGPAACLLLRDYYV